MRRLALPLLAALALTGAAHAQTLTGAAWTVTGIAGGALPQGPAPEIAFAEGGRVSGQSGCNRFMGGYAQDGQTLTFAALAATKMACPPDRMDLERRMFDALALVRSFAITPGGALELLGDAGLLIRAERR
jgi:heat shock protein HslJ